MDFKAQSVCIVLGPTGVGKTGIALRLALRLEGEVINCDSMQVYQGFDIGTDKLPEEQRKGVVHHLLDIVAPTHQFTAAEFAARASEAVAAIHARGRLPVITGGTGLYLKALLVGLFPEGRKDPEVRQKLDRETEDSGLETLRRRLEKIDPDYAAKIGSRDRIRIIRALEVQASTGRTMTENFALTRPCLENINIVKIGLQCERSVLNAMIEDRVDRMFERGLVEETRRILAGGVPEDAPPFRALGYRHVVRLIKKEITLEEAVALTKIDTRQYAKRQMTWFKKMEGIRWFSPQRFEEICEYVRQRI